MNIVVARVIMSAMKKGKAGKEVIAHYAKKLKLTDWISGDDVPTAHKTKYQAYRQALRDITSQSDPYNITWPTEP